jgi:hypothetical protein
MPSPACLCICVSTFINVRMPKPVFMKRAMYITKPESILTAYFINPSHQSVYLYVYPSYRC